VEKEIAGIAPYACRRCNIALTTYRNQTWTRNKAVSIPRFYVAPEFVSLAPGARLALPESAAHHAVRVLRLGAGDTVTLFDGTGGEYAAAITTAARTVEVKLGQLDPVERESPYTVELAQGISSGDKMDFTVQKAVELGAIAISPVIAERSVVKLSGERADKRVAHWQQVAIAACEQCGRNRVPLVNPIETLDRFLARCLEARLAAPDNGATSLLLSPRATRPLRALSRPDRALQLLVGPEGGFSEGEELAARAAGFEAVSLGRRVLRTETAALGALAAMSALWED
jgi:16S rRNA (uracil1498-N3)-methyltransferase